MTNVDDHLKELMKDPKFKKSFDREMKLLESMPRMFCPMCKNPLDLAPYYINHDTDWVGYDCYCEKCRWSGILETDEEEK